MLAYAANRRIVAGRRSAPNAMLFIVAGHVAAIAAVMSARMDLPTRIFHRTEVRLIPLPKDPPPPKPQARPQQRPSPGSSTLDQPDTLVRARPDPTEIVSITPAIPTFDALIGPRIEPRIEPRLSPVKLGPRLATPASDLKPPYPPSKLASEEEAVLRLRLTIDERGRVVGVEPVGRADSAFLEAARRHLLAHWRYKPATEDGRPVNSSAVITLRFKLEG